MLIDRHRYRQTRKEVYMTLHAPMDIPIELIEIKIQPDC